jgi:hypothetical protein
MLHFVAVPFVHIIFLPLLIYLYSGQGTQLQENILKILFTHYQALCGTGPNLWLAEGMGRFIFSTSTSMVCTGTNRVSG